MSETTVSETIVQSPPPAAMPARDSADQSDERVRLHQLAADLIRTHNRRALFEYLRLRRALRA